MIFHRWASPFSPSSPLVRLVRLQTFNFRLFLRQQTDKEKLSLVQWENGKRIRENCLGLSFPFFCRKWQHININININVNINSKINVNIKMNININNFIYTCTHTSLPNTRKKKLTENGNFRLFAVNRNGKRKFVFLGRQTINANRRLLFQQMYPSWAFSIFIYQ